jgi:hypothetical protein
LPTPAEIKEGRQNQRVYSWFCNSFLPAVVGTKHWADNHRTLEIREFVTTSDEAFAWVVYENNFERWKDMHRTGNAKTSARAARWTNAGRSQKDGRSKKFCGWSQDGIDAYNANYIAVGEDRASDLTHRSARFDAVLKAGWAVAHDAREPNQGEVNKEGLVGQVAMHDMPWGNAQVVAESSSEAEEGSSDEENGEEHLRDQY